MNIDEFKRAESLIGPMERLAVWPTREAYTLKAALMSGAHKGDMHINGIDAEDLVCVRLRRWLLEQEPVCRVEVFHSEFMVVVHVYIEGRIRPRFYRSGDTLLDTYLRTCAAVRQYLKNEESA